MPLFCAKHGAPVHVDVSGWREACEPALLRAKERRGGLVRRLYAQTVAVTVNGTSFGDTGMWGSLSAMPESLEARRHLLEAHLGVQEASE